MFIVVEDEGLNRENSLVPDFPTKLTIAPEFRPYSARNWFVIIRTSPIASGLLSGDLASRNAGIVDILAVDHEVV